MKFLRDQSSTCCYCNSCNWGLCVLGWYIHHLVHQYTVDAQHWHWHNWHHTQNHLKTWQSCQLFQFAFSAANTVINTLEGLMQRIDNEDKQQTRQFAWLNAHWTRSKADTLEYRSKLWGFQEISHGQISIFCPRAAISQTNCMGAPASTFRIYHSRTDITCTESSFRQKLVSSP